MGIKYEVVQNSLQPGTYYPRVVAGPTVTLEDMVANIVTKTALSATDVRAAISALTEEIAAALANGNPVRIDRLCRLRLSLSETLTEPEADVTSNVEVRVNMYADTSLQTVIKFAARLEREVRGVKKPIIVSFLDVASGQRDRYTPASIARVTGKNLKFDPALDDEGVFFLDEDGSEVRAQVYSRTSDTDITLLVPAGLANGQQLTVRTRYQGGQLRTATYDSFLLAA
jgi:predicted histone-like DNA-binding protein